MGKKNRRVFLPLCLLAAYLGDGDGFVALQQIAERGSGPYALQLFRIADQHQFCARFSAKRHNIIELFCGYHARLVDDQHVFIGENSVFDKLSLIGREGFARVFIQNFLRGGIIHSYYVEIFNSNIIWYLKALFSYSCLYIVLQYISQMLVANMQPQSHQKWKIFD